MRGCRAEFARAADGMTLRRSRFATSRPLIAGERFVHIADVAAR